MLTLVILTLLLSGKPNNGDEEMLKQTVVDYFDKKPSALAKALGVAPASVSDWGDVIPEKRAFQLERLTDGALKYDASLYMPKHKQTA
jgi:hypothetical protein